MRTKRVLPQSAAGVACELIWRKVPFTVSYHEQGVPNGGRPLGAVEFCVPNEHEDALQTAVADAEHGVWARHALTEPWIKGGFPTANRTLEEPDGG